MTDRTTTPPALKTRMEFHLITNHGVWPFTTPEAALAFAAEELLAGNSVHIYPMEVFQP